MGNLDFDVDGTNPISMDFEPLPKGHYLAQVSASEVVPTQAGTGLILKLTFEILEPDFLGRKAFDQLNIQNPSEKAQQIGRGMLSSLCRACGKTGIVSESYEIHEIPFVLGLKIDESPGYAPKNKVTSFASATKKGDNKEVLLNAQADDLPDFLK